MTAEATDLTAGYRRCAELTRQFGTTYYWGARILPVERRRHVFATYALCRLADYIVDADQATTEPQVEQTEHRLDAFQARFFSALRNGAQPGDDVMAAIVHTIGEVGMPQEYFERFFGAMHRDLTRSRYQTWPDLVDYMEGSAAVIGEMMVPVLGARVPDAVEPARALGFAFQLTNFLRDVGEDLDRNRVYLPQDDLARFGADPWRRTVDDAWRELMRFEIERNRELYRQADAGIAMMPLESARCVAIARILYSRILERIEQRDYDVFTGRARVPLPTKMAYAARGLTVRDPHQWAAG